LKEGYAELVAEIEQEMKKNQNQNRAAGSGNVPSAPRSGETSSDNSYVSNAESSNAQQPTTAVNAPLPSPDPIITVAPNQLIVAAPVLAEAPKPLRIAEFGKGLGRAVTEGSDEERDFEAPTDTILDRVHYLVNNLAPSNVEKKAAELKEMLHAKYFGWLGHFLVVKRISTQANFHLLYLSFIDNLGEYGNGLVEAVLRSVYRNIGKLLRSPKITTSSSERSYLKNLGIWLGQITLSRNTPILQIMLDCKKLLLQGYETGKLIAVAPFLAKTLEGAKNSAIFRPPNPWLMGLLGVFRAVYNVEGLKMNIKFEVEVLCKNLGIKLEDIPARTQILIRRNAPIKERNPDFNIKSASSQKAAAPAAMPRGAIASPEAQSLGLPIPHGDDSGRTTPTGADQQDRIVVDWCHGLHLSMDGLFQSRRVTRK
jgi:CCR4-NOT transcription complex subunit 1